VETVVEGCKAVISKSGAGEWDGVCLAVGLKRSVVPGYQIGGGRGGAGEEGDVDGKAEAEEWEVVCQSFRFEFVDGEVRGSKGKEGRNEFGGTYSDFVLQNPNLVHLTVFLLVYGLLIKFWGLDRDFWGHVMANL
jgi:hypothetical protein